MSGAEAVAKSVAIASIHPSQTRTDCHAMPEMASLSPAPRACPTSMPAACPRPRAGKNAMPLMRKAMLDAANSTVPSLPTTTRNTVHAASSPLIRNPIGIASERNRRNSTQSMRRAAGSPNPPALAKRSK